MCFHEFTLGEFGYRIAISGQKLIITATDANHMVVALKRFEVGILKSTLLAGSGFLKFSTTNDQYADFSQTQATLRSIISNGYNYSLSQTLVCSCPRTALFMWRKVQVLMALISIFVTEHRAILHHECTNTKWTALMFRKQLRLQATIVTTLP